MTRFDVLQAMTDVEEYARHVWYMAHMQESETDFKKLLMSELSEEGRQCMLNAARSGHPLSLERLQGDHDISIRVHIPEEYEYLFSVDDALYQSKIFDNAVKRSLEEYRKRMRQIEE